MATSGMTSTLLDSGFSEERMRRIRQETIRKWSELGFLEGLKGHVQENIALLYEGQASALINETEPEPSTFEYVQFPIVRRVMARWEEEYLDQENRLVIKSLKKHKL
jgi:hypothetical protein